MGAPAKEYHVAFTLLLHKKVNKEPQRRMRLWASSQRPCSRSQRNSDTLPPGSKLFPLLSATSQRGARVCGSLGPAFLRPPRAKSFLPLVLHPLDSTALVDLYWERYKVGSGSHTPALPAHKDSYHLYQEDGQESFVGKIRKNIPIPTPLAVVSEWRIIREDMEKNFASGVSQIIHPPTARMCGGVWWLQTYVPAATSQCPQCEASHRCPGLPLSCLDLSSNL